MSATGHNAERATQRDPTFPLRAANLVQAWLEARALVDEALYCAAATEFMERRGYLSSEHTERVQALGDECARRYFQVREIFDDCATTADGSCVGEIGERLAALESPSIDGALFDSFLELDQISAAAHAVRLRMQFLEIGGPGGECQGFTGRGSFEPGRYTPPITLATGYQSDAYCQLWLGLDDKLDFFKGRSPLTASITRTGADFECPGITGAVPLPVVAPGVDLWTSPMSFNMVSDDGGCRLGFSVSDPVWAFQFRVTGPTQNCATTDNNPVQNVTLESGPASVTMDPTSTACSLEFMLEHRYDESAAALGL